MGCECFTDKVVNTIKMVFEQINKRKKLIGVLLIILVAVGIVGGRKFWHYEIGRAHV